MKKFLIASIGILILWAPSTFARTQIVAKSRVALVIGNANYSVGPLKNPVNDAKDIAHNLIELGFEVICKENLNQREMKEVIRTFGEKIRNSAVALFYYSGHGLQVKGQNYLVPVNANINRQEDVDYECVGLETVLTEMMDVEGRTNIVILDACRNNPFVRPFRDLNKGLASMNAPKGTLIAYATSPGAVASDGSSRNGLYTQELLKNMRSQGLSIEDVFKRVRVAVAKETQSKQVPWESTSLTDYFSFFPKPGDTGLGITAESITPKITITGPVKGGAVERVQTAKGLAVNVPEGRTKWIYVSATDEGKYYFTEIPAETEDGEWEVIIYVGSKDDPPGSTYRIGIILADESTHKILLKKSQGLQSIPNNLKKFSEIVVKRK